MQVNITGNRLAEIFNQQAAAAKDPKKWREEKLAILESGGRKNRISGLFKGTYQPNLHDVVLWMTLFNLGSIDEAITYEIIEK